ncbi:hypothetical protein [Hymenobacter sp. UYP22]|uniref:hypothetical protein n=1 Tax=Hymenobacter sp. UYP22 TaxID=3156348 RepID=UPI0033946FF9
MHLTHLIEQLPRWQAVAQAPAVEQHELRLLESGLQQTLQHIASHRLVSATPQQLQTYFSLLEAYAQDVNQQPIATRQDLARQALRLCRALAHRPDR